MGIDGQLSTHLAVDDFGVVQLLDFTVHHMPLGHTPYLLRSLVQGVCFLFTIRALLGRIDFAIIED